MFHKCMSRILEGLEGVECNIDDVLVHAPIIELCDYRLQKVLEHLREAGVTLNNDKCTFRVPKIKFLENVSTNGIELDPDKIATVVNLHAPKNVHEVRTFAEHLADKTKLIRDLMQKDSQWVWGTPQQQAFKKI